MRGIDREAILEAFLLEAEENLVAAEDAAIALEARPDDESLVHTLFRAVHTLKGGADSLGLEAMTFTAHALEDLLDDLRGGRVAVTGSLMTLVLESLDALRACADRLRAGGSDEDATPQASQALREASLDQALRGAPLAIVERLRDARASGAASSATATPVAGSMTGTGDATVRRTGTLRVKVERLDAILGASGEIGMVLARLATRRAGEQRAGVDDALEELTRLHARLTDEVMAMRMVAVGPLLRSFVRTVRDVAAPLGKQARLVVEGGDVAVDANVIEQLREPMTHLVRNALSHGIEPPEERIARQKPACGRIVLRARRDAGALVVQVEDDGAGLDADRIAARARALGLPSPAREDELYGVLFAPGFSTAERVTDLAGRGVGLDAVKRAVEALRGTIAVAGKEGAGTTVTLRLPVSLALLDGFQVGLDDDVFVLPREAVRACAALSTPLDARGVGLADVAGTMVPAVRLRGLLDLPSAPRGSAGLGGARGPSHQDRESLVVVSAEGALLGLVVDRLFGEAKTLLTRTSPVLRAARVVAGCTVLGTGQVALVLDVHSLVQRALAGSTTRPGPTHARAS
jgi:two-component system chemotaxis sensor kinase CheA